MGLGWRMGMVMLVCIGGAPAHAWQSDARFNVEFETGAVWQSRNEIQIPDSATGQDSIFVDCKAAARRHSAVSN